MIYLLDANVFIEAKNRYYRFNICPGFWDWLNSNAPDVALSINPIRDELLAGNDKLKEYVQSLPRSHFLDVSGPITQERFRQVSNWVQNNNFKTAAIDKFLSGADPLLIAYAAALRDQEKNCTIVTLEQSDPKSKRQVFIPDVCKHFGVPFCDTFDYLEALHVKFYWKNT